MQIFTLSGKIYASISIFKSQYTYCDFCKINTNIKSNKHYKLLDNENIIFDTLEDYFLSDDDYINKLKTTINIVGDYLTIVFLNYDLQIIIDIYNYGFYSYDHVYSNDKELIKLVVNMHPHSIKYISNELKNDIEIITRVLLKYVSKNQQDD